MARIQSTTAGRRKFFGGVPSLYGLLYASSLFGQSCPVVVPLSSSADSTAQTLIVPVTADPSCAWTVNALPGWITSASSGTGNGSTSLALTANVTGADQSAVITINGSQLTVAQAFTSQVFPDVPPNAYYFDAVNLLSVKGITSGCGSANYCPDEAVTRDQMAVFLIRAVLGTGQFTYGSTPYFADVPATYWAFPWIQKLYELGFTAGCQTVPDLSYCPTEIVSRDQMAIFIVRARFGATTVFTFPPVPYFTDAPMSYFAFEWIQRLRQDDITTGCGATTFCPTAATTRGDMAIFVMRGAFNQLLPPGIPVLTSVTPPAIANGSTRALTVTGLNTNFVSGVTQVNSVPGLIVNSVVATNTTTLIVSVTANTTVPVQPISIWVIDPSEDIVLPNGVTVEQPLIDSFTTSLSDGYSATFRNGSAFELGLLPQIYQLNDGLTWPTGAGSFQDGTASVTASTIVGNTVQYVLTPTGDPLLQFTDGSFGDHTTQGSFGAAGPLTLTATIGSTTAVLSGYLLLEGNSLNYNYGANFNFFAAPIGALVPFSVTYTLSPGTWSSDTFNQTFTYYAVGQVTFAQQQL